MENSSETANAFAAIWQGGVADYINVQSEFSRALQNSNQRWLGRIQSMASGVCVRVEVDRRTLTVGRLRRLARMGRSVAKDFGRKLSAAV